MELSKKYEGEHRVRLVTVEQAVLKVRETTAVNSPTGAAEAVRELIGTKDREHFVVVHLDARHRMVSAELVSVGTLTSCLVHPREVFKGAFLANAAAIICAHNHPSGDLTPSPEDKALSDRLRDAGKMLGMPMLDFLIVSDTDSWSGRKHWSL